MGASPSYPDGEKSDPNFMDLSDSQAGGGATYMWCYGLEMSDRTALIICCSREQAARIHERAASERRTVSGYLLRVLMRWMDLEERLFVRQEDVGRPLTPYPPVRPSGKRTTMLLRCSEQEAQRIRAGAKRRSTTISCFVLHTLALSWIAQDRAFMETRKR
jgi:hypothetical protein